MSNKNNVYEHFTTRSISALGARCDFDGWRSRHRI